MEGPAAAPLARGADRLLRLGQGLSLALLLMLLLLLVLGRLLGLLERQVQGSRWQRGRMLEPLSCAVVLLMVRLLNSHHTTGHKPASAAT